MKVFIVNKSCHDFTAAEQFGELKFLSVGSLKRYDCASMYRQFSEIMKSSKPDDYLLLSGLAIMNSVASAIFAHKHKRLNLLLWNSQKKEYIERVIIL
jgi:hypothetical protein